MARGTAANVYRVDPNDPANHRMRARQDLDWGDLILTEEPLAKLNLSLRDVHDPDAFFSEDGEYSGAAAMELVRERMTAAEGRLFDDLRSGNGTPSDIFATNAFAHEAVHDGQTYVIFCVYAKISRINHSCRPNAVLAWDETAREGQGSASIRAITSIANGAEITLDYRASHEATFPVRDTRRAQLLEHWHFDCNCAACNAPRADVARDDRLRRDAARMYARLDNDTQRGRESKKARRNRRIREGEEYIGVLKRLNIRDDKLSDAYKHVSRLHLEHYEEARDEGSNHCRLCTSHGIVHHADEAYDMGHSRFETLMRCYGEDHTETIAQKTKLDDMMRKRAFARAPSMEFR